MGPTCKLRKQITERIFSTFQFVAKHSCGSLLGQYINEGLYYKRLSQGHHLEQW